MIIGLVGFKQVGKSTAAKYLEDKHKAKRINMKDALVSEIKQNFPDLLAKLADMHMMSVNQLFDVKPELMRALMQNYGTEVRRGDDQNYWTDRWKESVEGVKGMIVVDDVRFLNEAKAVREMGGIIVRLTRPDIETGGTHSSETEQLSIEVDETIHCEPGSHQKLYEEMENLIQAYIFSQQQ